MDNTKFLIKKDNKQYIIYAKSIDDAKAKLNDSIESDNIKLINNISLYCEDILNACKSIKNNKGSSQAAMHNYDDMLQMAIKMTADIKKLQF